jgi:hypothetical protein
MYPLETLNPKRQRACMQEELDKLANASDDDKRPLRAPWEMLDNGPNKVMLDNGDAR